MKTAIIIFLGIWFVFTMAGIFTIGFKKTMAINRWFVVFFFIGLFGLVTEWFFYWLAFPLQRLGKFSPFWIWMDDSRLDKSRSSGYHKDYEIYLNHNKETYFNSYNWHMRNRVWNLYDLFRPRQGVQTNIEFVIDDMERNGKKIQDGGKYQQICGLKYITEDGESGWQVNRGKYISREYSTTGESMIWYNVGNWLGFRYSFCQVRPFLFFWERWHTIKAGTGRKRFKGSNKYQKTKLWQ